MQAELTNHIDKIHAGLSIQIKRMAQIWVEVDELRAKMKRLP